MTHDYVRHGTTTLFAAIELAQGKLIGTCMSRHRHQEWTKFLELIERWFRQITDDEIRRGAFTSVKQLVATIGRYIALHNVDPPSLHLDQARRTNPRKSPPRQTNLG